MNNIYKICKHFNDISKEMILNLIQEINDGVMGIFATFIENIGVILPIIIFVGMLIKFLLSFKSKANKISKDLLNIFSSNKKYIKGLFVELNDTKEYLRYNIYGKKWKKRIVYLYNSLFDDEYGNHLKLIFGDDINLSLNKFTKFNNISDTIKKTYDLVKQIHTRGIHCSEEYRETEILFEIHGRKYVERLEKLKLYLNFSNSRYIVLTGSAGNGKTNILCNFCQTLIDKRDICIFVNSSNVEEDLDTYIKDKFSNKISKKWFDIFWIIENIFCFIRRKSIYIVIDAINENDKEIFYKSTPKFINRMLKFPMVKIVVSCRSEYFDLKYKSILVDQIKFPVLCYDITFDDYSIVAKERLFENYCKAYDFYGIVSAEVKEKLYNQLLLMRMFFEVNEGCCLNVNTLNKYEIFQKYIENITNNSHSQYLEFINKIVNEMYESENYISVKLSKITDDPLPLVIKNFIDETILFSRKLVLHKNTIIEKEDEEIYFVFDEMRDYCIARYVLNKFCGDDNQIVDEKVILFITKLTQNHSVCSEGVINYIYWYYKSVNNDALCEQLLGFMKEHDDALESYDPKRIHGLRSWGLKVIFENENEVLKYYEENYIKYIMIENPGNELLRLFSYLLNQEELNGVHNLSIFLKLLFSINDVDVFMRILSNSISSWGGEITYHEFIDIDKRLSKCNIQGRRRFLVFVNLFLTAFTWEDDQETKNYFNPIFESKRIKQFVSENIKFAEKVGESNEY